jgi:hypothetical protein
MSARRVVFVLVMASVLTTVAVQPALASDEEHGFLSCPTGVVWITQRTSPGVTTVSWRSGQHQAVQRTWTTGRVRTGLSATWWRVMTTGAMDHRVTGASCRS